MKSMLKEGKSTETGDDSGDVNADSGNYRKVFTIDRNERSRFCGIGVHDKPEWVFTVSRNMHGHHSRPPFAADSVGGEGGAQERTEILC